MTWRARGSESAIDLIFTTPGLTEVVKSYRVRLDLQIGSDYLLVYIELDLSIEEAPTTRRRA